MLFITTSRRPAIRTRIFIKELERVIPGAKRIIRGKKGLEDLERLLFINGVSKLVIVENKKGNPWALRFYRYDFPRLTLVCTMYVKGLSLQVDTKRKKFVSFLDIKDECGNEESKRIYGLLCEFIPESSYIKRVSGIHGVLKVKCKNDEYILSFEDEKGNYIYPIIRLNKVEIYE